MGAWRGSFNIRARVTVGGFAAFLVACGGENPSAPTRYGPPILIVSCTAGTSPLLCTARIECWGFPCAPEITATDVTSQAVWESGDPSVARIIALGAVEAVGTGDTLVRAHWQHFDAQRTVSVFPGTPPLPTHEIFGGVWEAGKTPATGAISGANIEVTSGLLAGRSVTSGVPPPLLPGFFGPFGGPGYYRILGVPPGTYRLRVRREGYITQERDVTVSNGSPLADFQLSPL
jgi:hypothetical protein